MVRNRFKLKRRDSFFVRRRVIHTNIYVQPKVASILKSILAAPLALERSQFEVSRSQTHSNGKCEILATKLNSSLSDDYILGIIQKLLCDLKVIGQGANQSADCSTVVLSDGDDSLLMKDDSVCILSPPPSRELRLAFTNTSNVNSYADFVTSTPLAATLSDPIRLTSRFFPLTPSSKDRNVSSSLLPSLNSKGCESLPRCSADANENNSVIILENLNDAPNGQASSSTDNKTKISKQTGSSEFSTKGMFELIKDQIEKLATKSETVKKMENHQSLDTEECQSTVDIISISGSGMPDESSDCRKAGQASSSTDKKTEISKPMGSSEFSTKGLLEIIKDKIVNLATESETVKKMENHKSLDSRNTEERQSTVDIISLSGSGMPDESSDCRVAFNPSMNIERSKQSSDGSEASSSSMDTESSCSLSEDDIVIEKVLKKNGSLAKDSSVKAITIEDSEDDDDVLVCKVLKKPSKRQEESKLLMKDCRKMTTESFAASKDVCAAPDFIPLGGSRRQMTRQPFSSNSAANLDFIPLNGSKPLKKWQQIVAHKTGKIVGHAEGREKLTRKEKYLTKIQKVKEKQMKKQGIASATQASTSSSSGGKSKDGTRCSGDNIMNPNAGELKESGLRPVVIDANNIAVGHGRGEFSAKGLIICIKYFVDRGHKVVALVPKFRRFHISPEDRKSLDDLEKQGIISYTPSRTMTDGRRVASYDDRFIVQAAYELGAVIVSTDNFRDLLAENEKWRELIERRLLMFTWVGDILMFPDDPLGRNGPKLADFLRFPAQQNDCLVNVPLI